MKLHISYRGGNNEMNQFVGGRNPFKLNCWILIGIFFHFEFIILRMIEYNLNVDNFKGDTPFLFIQKQSYSKKYSSQKQAIQPVKLSLVILTYKKRKLFQLLLHSIVRQETNFGFEVIVGDNGCVNGLYGDIIDILGGKDLSNSGLSDKNSSTAYVKGDSTMTGINFKYLPMCDNPGYSYGNNRASELADSDSEYVLFLNDDITMQDTFFLQSMIDLIELHSDTAGAVGCVILNSQGTKLLEAGSIVWNDGSTMGFARGRTDFIQPHSSEDLHFARPVDFISGACLMVEIDILRSIGGFDGKSFPAYYEDTDMQMKVPYIHNKEVWLQPLAVALHAEHSSFGSSNSVTLMQNSHETFVEIWGSQLETFHLFPGPLSERPDFEAFRASDVRGRETTQFSPNILYIDDMIPIDNRRNFDNLILLQQMGYRVTLFATTPQPNSFSNVYDACKDFRDVGSVACVRHSLQQAGVEVIQQSENNTLENLLTKRSLYYNVIVVTNSETIDSILSQNSSTLFDRKDFDQAVRESIIIYDSGRYGVRSVENFLRKHELETDDEITTSMSTRQFLRGTGLSPTTDQTDKIVDSVLSKFRLDLNVILHHADAVLTESDYIREQLWEFVKSESETSAFKVSDKRTRLLKEDSYITTIGHINMEPRDSDYPPLENRKIDILFVGTFRQQETRHCPTASAAKYFMNDIYPLLLQQMPSTTLTIVGRDIPQDFYDEVSNSLLFNNLVTLVESRSDAINPTHYFDNSKIFIVPYKFTTGIKYEVSQALAAGVPTIMSGEMEQEYGNSISDHGVCVGETPEIFAQCIVKISSDAKLWYEHHKQAKEFATLTQMKTRNKLLWRNVLDDGFRRKRERGESISELHPSPSTGIQSKQCKQIVDAYYDRYQEDFMEDDHFSVHNHFYNSDIKDGFIFDLEAEKTYLSTYKDAKQLVYQRTYMTGWHHFISLGQYEGYIYDPVAERQYLRRYSDVQVAVTAGVLVSGWVHFFIHGKKKVECMDAGNFKKQYQKVEKNYNE